MVLWACHLESNFFYSVRCFFMSCPAFCICSCVLFFSATPSSIGSPSPYSRYSQPKKTATLCPVPAKADSDDNCGIASEQLLQTCWSFMLARPAQKGLALGSSVALIASLPLALVTDNFKGLYQKVEGTAEFEIQAVPCPGN